jgi:CHAD domain-containing protein
MSISLKRRASLFRKTERDILKLSSNQEPETVHRFRTSVRRLQTLLEVFVPEPNRKQKKLLKVLGLIRKRAGKVRDLDVQLAALRSLKIPQEPRRKTRLTHNLIELRAKHEKHLRKLLTKDDIRDIRKRLKRAMKDVPIESSADLLLVARQTRAQVNRPAGALTQDVLHQYRVAVKRARYAAELAPQSAEATQFIAQMKRQQDAVGDWRDWLTLTQTAEARIGHVQHSSLVAALRNVTAGKFRRAAAVLSAAQPSRRPVVAPVSQPSRTLGLVNPAQDNSAA